MEERKRTGILQEKTNFGNNSFFYGLRYTQDLHLSANFNNNTTTLYVPDFMILELADTDTVGFSRHVDLNNPLESMYLLLEKDFTCFDNVEEDQSDNYPNPLKVQL